MFLKAERSMRDPGQRLRALRRTRDMSQAELALSAGLTARTIRDLENGKGYVTSLRAAFAVLGYELAPAVGKRIDNQRLAVDRIPDKAAWSTPPELLAQLYRVFRFDLDPCSPIAGPTVKARHHYTKHNDGLVHTWPGTVFLNPPYDDIPTWIAKALEEFDAGRAQKIVSLVPAALGTRWWRQIVASGAVNFVLEGRLRFGGCSSTAPFASALVTWGLSDGELARLGKVLPAHHRVTSVYA